MIAATRTNYVGLANFQSDDHYAEVFDTLAEAFGREIEEGEYIVYNDGHFVVLARTHDELSWMRDNLTGSRVERW